MNQSVSMKTACWLMLAALMVPALASASMDACIAACSGDFLAADDAHCVLAADECHPVTVAASDCCEGDAAAHTAGAVHEHDASGCSCPTCNFAPSRYLMEQPPVKLPPVAKAIVSFEPFPMPATVSLVLADEARSARIRTGPTRAQLCIYLR